MMKKKYEIAIHTLKELIEKHPNSKEIKDSEKLIKIASTNIAKIKDEKEKERKRKLRDQKERFAKAVRLMEKKYDKLEDITWYKDKTTKDFGTTAYLYFGKKSGGSPWLRFKLRYFADDWLFIRSFFIVSDEMRFDYNPADFERDNSGGNIWEWNDFMVTQNEIHMIEKIIESKESTIRFNGDQYHSDHEITDKEKRCMKNVLDAFYALGGRFEETN